MGKDFDDGSVFDLARDSCVARSPSCEHSLKQFSRAEADLRALFSIGGEPTTIGRGTGERTLQ